MENQLQNAIEQMRNGEEAGLHYIYTRTYNFVYLRAKTVLNKEDDISQLMKEVYLELVARGNRIHAGNLYEWLGKQTYCMGCKKYRKKNVREADFIELTEDEYTAPKTVDQESTCEIIENALEQLPDMYQATFYAFYYDYMRIEDIARVMDSNVGVVLNRFNYIHKYLQKALADYQEDTKARVQFSLEAACATVKMWSQNHAMSEVVAQSVYSGICRESGLLAGTIQLEDGETAGADKTIVAHEEDDLHILMEELGAYRSKPGIGKKQIAIVVVVALAFVALVLGIVIFTGKSDKEAPEKEGQKVEQESQDAKPQEEAEDVPVSDNAEEETSDAEYILPHSDTVELTRQDLQGLSKAQLRLARNEIFARYGMIFGAADLSEYFSAKSWYVPRIAFDDFYDTVEMNLIEEANLSLIMEVEGEMQ